MTAGARRGPAPGGPGSGPPRASGPGGPGWPGWPPEIPAPPAPGTPPGPPGLPPGAVPPPVPMVYDAPSPRPDDVADQLLRQRRVVVGGRLDAATATDVAARLMLLDGSGDDPVEVLMSCPDGDGGAAMALADTVELMGVEVRTVCTGVVGGPAVLPFALGTRRLAAPHATFVLGDPPLQFEGAARDLTTAADQHAGLVAALHRRLADATGRPLEAIAADAGRRRLLTADEAVAYGLVDEVVRRHLRSV